MSLSPQIELLVGKLNSEDFALKVEAKKELTRLCSVESLAKLFTPMGDQAGLRDLVTSAVAAPDEELPRLVGEQLMKFLATEATAAVFSDAFMTGVAVSLMSHRSIGAASVGSRLLLSFFLAADRVSASVDASSVERIQSALLGSRGQETEDEEPSHAYDSFLRFLDSNESRLLAVDAVWKHCPSFIPRFLHNVALSFTDDVLLFLNFVTAVDSIVESRGTQIIPQELSDVVTRILTSSGIEAELSRPTVVCFARTCIVASPGSELAAQWTKCLLRLLCPGEAALSTVEIIGQIAGSSSAALKLLFTVDTTNTWIHFMWNGVRSGPDIMRLKCLRGLRYAAAGISKASAAEATDILNQCCLLPQEAFSAALWPLRTHFESEIRSAVWEFLAALAQLRHDSHLRVFAHVAASFLSSTDVVEMDRRVRDMQRRCAEMLLKCDTFRLAEQGTATYALRDKLRIAITSSQAHDMVSVGVAAD